MYIMIWHLFMAPICQRFLFLVLNLWWNLIVFVFIRKSKDQLLLGLRASFVFLNYQVDCKLIFVFYFICVWRQNMNQRFCCGGRMIFGPDVGSLFLSTLLIGVPALVFCSQVLKKIERHDPCLGYPVLALALAITILVSSIPFPRLTFL